MALPEILPIRTSARVLYEIRPTTKTQDGVEVEGYDWFPVREIGKRLTAEVSPISYIPLREAARVADHADRAVEILRLANVRTYFNGAALEEGASAIPELHCYSLVAKVYALSSVGSDPFAAAPAGSPH